MKFKIDKELILESINPGKSNYGVKRVKPNTSNYGAGVGKFLGTAAKPALVVGGIGGGAVVAKAAVNKLQDKIEHSDIGEHQSALDDAMGQLGH